MTSPWLWVEYTLDYSLALKKGSEIATYGTDLRGNTVASAYDAHANLFEGLDIALHQWIPPHLRVH